MISWFRKVTRLYTPCARHEDPCPRPLYEPHFVLFVCCFSQICAGRYTPVAMHSSGLILVCLLVMPTFVPALPHKLHVRDAVLSSDAKPQKKSFSVPIRRREISRAEQHRRDDTGDEASGSIGLGNIADK